MNKKQINEKHLTLHNALGSRKDAEDKEAFDIAHRKVWADCDIELNTRKAELEAKDVLASEEQTELTELVEMFPTPLEPSRDLAAEIDELKAKMEELEAKQIT